jgi:hypothetical protein
LKPGLVIILSGAVLLLLAGTLLAADGTAGVTENAEPDTTRNEAAALVGVQTPFQLEQKPEFKHSPRTSILLSTALPGLGQARNGRWAKATAFLVVGAMLVTQTVVESERATRYLHLARTAPSEEEAEAYYDLYSTHFDRRDSFIWWSIGFWVLNMFDAYIDGHLFGFSRQ